MITWLTAELADSLKNESRAGRGRLSMRQLQTQIFDDFLEKKPWENSPGFGWKVVQKGGVDSGLRAVNFIVEIQTASRLKDLACLLEISLQNILLTGVHWWHSQMSK